MYSHAPSHVNLPDPVMQPEFYADVPVKRGLAWIIDTMIITVLILPIIVMTAFVGLFFLPVLFLIVGFVYRWLSLAGGSATIGMRMMAIEFRDSEGRRFDAGTAFLHTLGYSLSMAFVLAQIASIALMFISERGQGLTDHILGTVAINRRGR